jgi:hypothetical protein
MLRILFLSASVAQLVEQLTLNLINVYKAFVTVCLFVIFRDFLAQTALASPVSVLSCDTI